MPDLNTEVTEGCSLRYKRLGKTEKLFVCNDNLLLVARFEIIFKKQLHIVGSETAILAMRPVPAELVVHWVKSHDSL